jgi:hypothetical protein
MFHAKDASLDRFRMHLAHSASAQSGGLPGMACGSSRIIGQKQQKDA